MLLNFLNTSYSLGQQVNENHWQIWAEKQNITVSYRTDISTQLKEIKASIIVDSTLSAFLLFLQDINNTPNWLVNAQQNSLIKQPAENEHIFTIAFAKIWPFKKRLLSVHSIYWQNKDLSVEIALSEYKKQRISIKTLEEFVLITLYKAHWKITPKLTPQGKTQLYIDYTFIADGAGNSPTWLANHFTLKSIYKSMKNLKAQLPNSVYQKQTLPSIIELK